MAKQKILVLFGVTLLLQFAVSLFHRQAPNSFEKEDLSFGQTAVSNEFEEYLADEVLPLLVYTSTLLEMHGRHILRQTRIFLKAAVRELKELPKKSEGIKANIMRLNELIQRIEAIDLEGDSSAVLYEKSSLLNDIALMLTDIDLMAKDDIGRSDAIVLKEVFRVINLNGLHKSLVQSAATTVHKFSIIFARFWNSLSTAAKLQLSELSDWWIKFCAAKSANEKIKEFLIFFKIFI